MFGIFKKAKEAQGIYRRQVRDFLREELGIEIDSERNPAFYSAWALEDLITKGFYNGVNSTHCALIIARHHLYELLKRGAAALPEAKRLNTMLDFKASLAASHGVIPRETYNEYEDELRTMRMEKFG